MSRGLAAVGDALRAGLAVERQAGLSPLYDQGFEQILGPSIYQYMYWRQVNFTPPVKSGGVAATAAAKIADILLAGNILSHDDEMALQNAMSQIPVYKAQFLKRRVMDGVRF